MSEDIVERLQRAEQMADGRGSGLFKEAADYIVQLQGALQEMRDLAGMPDVGASIISGSRLVRDCAHHEHKPVNSCSVSAQDRTVPEVGI